MLSKISAFLWFSLWGVTSTYAQQQRISVQLTVVSRSTSHAPHQDVGLLVDVKNLADQDIALYTPLGSMAQAIKYYKLDPQTRQYREMIHPLVQELRKEMAFKDSVFKVANTIVDNFGRNNYNAKSALYNEFIRNDSLWYGYLFRSSQYKEQIKDADREHFKIASGMTGPALFTLLKAQEHFQDFSVITFLYQTKGDYKIVLELPAIDLQKTVRLADTFVVMDNQLVRCNPVYISVR
ncbi:hypothetical protein GCM10027347_40400 [Larkinella harenae]